MNRHKQNRVSVISGIGGSIVFLILFNLSWSLWICILLSLLTFVGLGFVLQPVEKIGDIPVDELDQGQRLAQIYEQAEIDLTDLRNFLPKIQDQKKSAKARELLGSGEDILKVLSQEPQLLSRSEHFLSYYLGTSKDILSNYLNLQDSHLSPDQWKKVEENTSQSLDYLQDIFARQRDSYHKHTIMELEAQSELLEKTVKLGGGRTNNEEQ